MDAASSTSPQPGTGSSPTAGPDLASILAWMQQQQQQQQQLMQQSMQQQQMQMQQQQQQFLQSMLAAQQQATVALLQQQAAPQGQPSAAQLLTLSSLGQLQPFAGKASTDGLAGREWLARAEHYFDAREAALNVQAAQSDGARLAAARNALTDDALRWLLALPQQPSTWADFRTKFIERFSSVPAEQVREAHLHRFVEAARRLREKLSAEGMQRYTTVFLQHAGQVSATRMTDATKRMLYAQGLPSKYAELVLTEDAKAQPPPLHEIAQKVLAKATLKAHATATIPGVATGASGSPPPTTMDIDAISLCATQFGVSRDEAAAYLEDTEGWQPHDTDGKGAVASSSSAPPPGPPPPTVEQILAAIDARYAGRGGKSNSQRRNVPAPIRADVPQELAEQRKQAGLCVRCGVKKYEGGKNGHNARTCHAPVDRTTSASDGKRAAGLF
jgi:hypothetical protein